MRSLAGESLSDVFSFWAWSVVEVARLHRPRPGDGLVGEASPTAAVNKCIIIVRFVALEAGGVSIVVIQPC